MLRELDQGAFSWRKSSASTQEGECVEVGSFPTGEVAVRDTKGCGSGPVLGFTTEAWAAFVSDVKDGRFAV
jgi:hypothetical protein